MADLTNKHRNFVARAIDVAEKGLAFEDALNDLRQEWDELGYAGSFSVEAFEGDGAHLNIANLADLAQAQATIKGGFDAGIRADLLAFRK